MAKTEVTRVINGVTWICEDVGCPDFDKAAENRKNVEEGFGNEAWEIADRLLRRTPLGSKLPATIPTGTLPQVTREDWEQASGGRGLHEEDDESLILELTKEGRDIVKKRKKKRT